MAVATLTTNTTSHERVVLITGCSAGGMGYHMALEFAARGCRVFAGLRTLSKAESLTLNSRIEVVELDVTNAASVDAAITHVLGATGGRIDMLVNNAGVLCSGPAVEVDMAQVQQLFDTNIVGLARLCSTVAPIMMDRRQGTIVNISSASGYAGVPWFSFYAASKAAVNSYSDALRMELKPFGVKVVVIAPGYIKSNMPANRSDSRLDQASSRYEMAFPVIDNKIAESQGETAVPTDKFACDIVPRVLCPSPSAYITYGTESEKPWIMYYMPPVVSDYIIGHIMGTHQLAKDLQASLAASEGGAAPRLHPLSSSVVVWTALATVALGIAYSIFQSW
ncbi:hypothetical protein GGI20_002942 [Coemansia sp. BCRC 34301]|nr:hypothetical protein GGI20_002942 [Coemansia sp. BCRC 34301]